MNVANYFGPIIQSFKKVANADSSIQIKSRFRNQIKNGNDFEKNIKRRSLEQVRQAEGHANADSRLVVVIDISPSAVIVVTEKLDAAADPIIKRQLALFDFQQ